MEMYRNRSIDSKIESVSAILGDELYYSLGKLEMHEMENQRLEELWNDIRNREEKYSENKAKLFQIKDDLNSAKTIFQEDFKNALNYQETQYQMEIEHSKKVNENCVNVRQEINLVLQQIQNQKSVISRLNETENTLKSKEQEVDTRILNLDNSGHNERIKGLNNQIHEAQTDVDIIEHKINDFETKIQTLENKDKICRSEILNLRNRKNIINTKIDSMQTMHRNESLEKQRNTRNQTFVKQKKKQEIKDMEFERDEMKQKCNELEEKIRKIELENTKLTNQVTEKENLIESKQKNLEKIKREAQELEEHTNRVTNKRIEREKGVIDITKQVQKKIETARTLKKKEEQNIKECAKEEEKIKEKNKEVIQLLGNAYQQEQQLEHIAKEIDSQFFSIEFKSEKDMEKEHKNLLEELNVLHQDITNASIEYKKNEESLSEIGKINQKLVASDKRVKQIQSGNLTLHKQVKQILAINKQLRKTVHLLERKINKHSTNKILVKNKTEIIHDDKEYGKLQLCDGGDDKISYLVNSILTKQNDISKKKKKVNSFTSSFSKLSDINVSYHSPVRVVNHPSAESIQKLTEILQFEKRKLQAVKPIDTTNYVCEWCDRLRALIADAESI